MLLVIVLLLVFVIITVIMFVIVLISDSCNALHLASRRLRRFRLGPPRQGKSVRLAGRPPNTQSSPSRRGNNRGQPNNRVAGGSRRVFGFRISTRYLKAGGGWDKS